MTADATGDQWRQLAAEMVAAIRAVDPNHLLVVGPVYGTERAYRPIGPGETLDRPVEQRYVGHSKIRWKRIGVDRESVVLTGDQHLAGVHVLDRMVRPVMAELHLQRASARCQAHDLMPETDAEGRHSGVDQ